MKEESLKEAARLADERARLCAQMLALNDVPIRAPSWARLSPAVFCWTMLVICIGMLMYLALNVVLWLAEG